MDAGGFSLGLNHDSELCLFEILTPKTLKRLRSTFVLGGKHQIVKCNVDEYRILPQNDYLMCGMIGYMFGG